MLTQIDDEPGFSAAAAADAAGITYRQLDYWVRLGMLCPSIATARGSGSRRRFSFEDVRVIRAVAAVVEMGAQISQLAPLIAELDSLRAWEGPLFVSRSGRCGRRLEALEGRSCGFVLDLAAFTRPVPQPSIDITPADRAPVRSLR